MAFGCFVFDDGRLWLLGFAVEEPFAEALAEPPDALPERPEALALPPDALAERPEAFFG